MAVIQVVAIPVAVILVLAIMELIPILQPQA
jgi:hypothetical protein